MSRKRRPHPGSDPPSMSLSLAANRISEWPLPPGFESLMLTAAGAALEAEGPRAGEVSITLVDESEIRALNHEYLGHDRPTDVISFELGDGGNLIGDVYICPEIAARNADERGERLDTEVLRLVIHGCLHLIGLDHPQGPGRETSPMFALQEELLRALAPD